MPKDSGVEAGDVDRRKNAQRANYHRPEQELVLPDVVEEGEAACAFGIKGEHGSREALAFPGEDENEPGQFGEDGSSRAEYNVTGGVVGPVAVVAEAVLTRAVYNEDEGHQCADAHDRAIDEHVGDDLPREDAFLGVVWWPLEDVRGCLLLSEAESREGRGEHVDPEDG